MSCRPNGVRRAVESASHGIGLLKRASRKISSSRGEIDASQLSALNRKAILKSSRRASCADAILRRGRPTARRGGLRVCVKRRRSAARGVAAKISRFAAEQQSAHHGAKSSAASPSLRGDVASSRRARGATWRQRRRARHSAEKVACTRSAISARPLEACQRNNGH